MLRFCPARFRTGGRGALASLQKERQHAAELGGYCAPPYRRRRGALTTAGRWLCIEVGALGVGRPVGAVPTPRTIRSHPTFCRRAWVGVRPVARVMGSGLGNGE